MQKHPNTLFLVHRSPRTLLAIALVTLAACSAPQVDKARRFGVSAVPFFAKLAIAYGSPYAEVVRVFADTVDPSWNADGRYDRESEGGSSRESATESMEGDAESVRDEAIAMTSREEQTKETSADEGTLMAQVDVVRERLESGERNVASVVDGDVLREEDNYKLQVRCTVDCFAYIAQLDSTGRMDPILPSELVSLRNPLTGGDLYSIPVGDDWFYLDGNTGVEQIYFILSEERRPEIEEIFTKLVEGNRALALGTPITVEEPLVLTRGIGGVRRGRTQEVRLSSDRDEEYVSTLFESRGSELVITRWFYHR